jgi:signal transduction histidine kinase
MADLLACVLEALPLGIGLFELRNDGPTVFRGGNREFARVLRLKRVPDDGEPIGQVFVGADRDSVRHLFEQVKRRAEPQSYFAPETAEAAQQRIWNLDAYPVFTGGRVTHVMVLAEQSEQKLEVRQRQQQETDRLREKADQLAELEKAKSEFLRLASHELRGPAAMLGGYLSMMEEEALGPIPERLRPVLPLLRTKAAQINMLANEMVEAARLEDRRLQLKRKRVDLREIARRSFQAALPGLSAKHNLHFEDRAGGPTMVLGDTMRLEIIIGNLLDNAIKYSPEGGEIIVQLSRQGGMAFLSIRDAGIGIRQEDMDRLFIRFNRIAPRADVPGTGLGLYLARELARLHGGEIVAVSKLGEGSEFTLSLPLDQDNS